MTKLVPRERKRALMAIDGHDLEAVLRFLDTL
jgi:hypothetical protein